MQGVVVQGQRYILCSREIHRLRSADVQYTSLFTIGLADVNILVVRL